MIHLCRCGFATDDAEWFEEHQDQYGHRPDRPHDVSWLTVGELERARRDPTASLALAYPGSHVRVTVTAHIAAIDAELAGRTAGRPDDLPGSPFAPGSLVGSARRVEDDDGVR